MCIFLLIYLSFCLSFYLIIFLSLSSVRVLHDLSFSLFFRLSIVRLNGSLGRCIFGCHAI